MALGLQENTNEIFYMLLAILFHKWVEALSIGINLYKSNIDKDYLFKLILLFSAMTPLGMVLGMIFSGFSNILEAVFLSISAGN
jgi:zinc transporter 1/2/3